LNALGGDDKSTSREARKESRSLGIFKGVSNKSPESPTTSPPPQQQRPQQPQLTISEPTATATTTTVTTTQEKPVEKKTKTTATYYPKRSRQESLIRSPPTIIEESPSREPKPSSSLKPPAAGAGAESESDSELPPDWNSPTSVALKPYSHQVGGHSALFKFSRHAVCKPLVEKENAFYQDIEINRPECKSIPKCTVFIRCISFPSDAC